MMMMMLGMTTTMMIGDGNYGADVGVNYDADDVNGYNDEVIDDK